MLRILILTLVTAVFAPARAVIPDWAKILVSRSDCQALLTWQAVTRSKPHLHAEIESLRARLPHVSEVQVVWRESRPDLAQAAGRSVVRMMPGNTYRVGLWNSRSRSERVTIADWNRQGLFTIQRYRVEPYQNITILSTETGLWEQFDLLHVLNLYVAAALAPQAHLLMVNAYLRPDEGGGGIYENGRPDDFSMIQKMKREGRPDAGIFAALNWRGAAQLLSEVKLPLKLVQIHGWKFNDRQPREPAKLTDDNPDEWEIRLYFPLP